jgi:hypothetical protein
MATIKDVCRHLRSKNAGPYWVTVDLFFDSTASFEKYSENAKLGPALFASLYGTDPKLVKRFLVASLNMVKISYPRASAQGGEVERDLHSGQQFVRLLDVELD